jgi:hypothetical protein
VISIIISILSLLAFIFLDEKWYFGSNLFVEVVCFGGVSLYLCIKLRNKKADVIYNQFSNPTKYIEWCWFIGVIIIIGLEILYSILMFAKFFTDYDDKVKFKNSFSLIYVFPSIFIMVFILSHYKKQSNEIDLKNIRT